MQNRLTYDVVVIGGGLVGASLALALRPLKLKVAVLEAQPPELDAVPDAAVAHRWQPSFDARSSALAWGTRQLYQRLGLWEAIAPHAYPIRHIEVSERGRLGTSHLTAAEQQVEALGYVVPNTWLGQHLWCALQASEVDLYTPCELQQLRFPSAEQAELEAQGPEGRFTLGARLVILADGGRSGIKQQLGIVDDVHDYQQSALIANLRLSRPHQGWAYERFTQQGALALLPLQQRQMALVWTHPRAEAERLMQLDAQALIAELQQVVGARAGCIEQIGERFVYPLKKIRAQEQVRQRLVVLGNAAHYLHPVAGQGYNLAIRGVMSLADHLARAQQLAGDQQQDFDPGRLPVLQAWAMAREGDQREVIGFSHGLIQLFGQPQPWMAHARAAGLIGLNLFGPARRWLAKKAMGAR